MAGDNSRESIRRSTKKPELFSPSVKRKNAQRDELNGGSRARKRNMRVHAMAKNKVRYIVESILRHPCQKQTHS